MNPSDRERQQLIAGCQGLVRTLAWQIHRKLPPQVELDDLIAYGQIGLAEGSRDFDPARGTQFTTFAYYRIRGAILDGLSKMSWFNKSDYWRGRYERMANEVLDLERADAAAEQETPLEQDARWLKGASASLAMVYLFSHRSSGDDEDETGAATVEDRAVQAPSAVAIKREMVQRLHELVDALPDDAAKLLRATYFEGLTLKEAGERIGISKAWASRLHAKSLGQLARSLRLSQLAD